ncbi:MAG: pentapeptide repeat-containing protein [Nitrospirota bacterium]
MSLYFYWQITKYFQAHRLKHLVFISILSLCLIFYSWYIISIPTNKNNNLDRLFHRSIVINDKIITYTEVSDIIIAQYLRDNKTKEDAIRGQAEKLDLKGRDLSYSNFSYSKFIKTDLSLADLQGADLSSADLQGAVLSSAKLQGAVLSSAKLQGAVLSSAKLQGAVLSSADLQVADLSSADLQGAVLVSADLQGAVLYSADLQRAVLSLANLQGAYLFTADLQGAYLSSANLQGAYLVLAKLQGAYLSSAKLQGAYLSSADLHCSSIDTNTNLMGIYYNNINNLFNLDKNTEIDNKTPEECKLFDAKSKATMIQRLESNKNPKLFLEINKKLACNNVSRVKMILFRSHTITLDNGTNIEFNDVIKNHMKENCPQYLSRP